jgi:hypothetical protein
MEQLFGAIPSALGGLGPNAETDEALVFAAWIRCAGGGVCKRTAPLEFFENRLVIAVEDETWRRHLEDLSPQMLARINGSLGHGTLNFIEFRVDPANVKRARVLNKRSNEGVANRPAAVAASLATAAEAIADAGLREQFLSTAGEYLARQKREMKAER